MNKFSFNNKDIKLDHILLDPNNYRFLDNLNYKKKINTKFHVPAVQEATIRLLDQNKNYQLSELKRSILKNGYVPMERVVVIPYEHKAGYYLTVEGNRRIASLKSILQEKKEGVRELTNEQLKAFSNIPCSVLIATKNEIDHAQRVIMGIRHIAGPRQWGAYQQAQLIVELYEGEGQDFQSIADHLGISPIDVNRRYRAMKALKSMEQDELYADRVNFGHYNLFNELVSGTAIKEYFTWNDKELNFTDITKAREFYELIAPQAGDQDAKLRTYADVRKLRIILPHAKAMALLLDPEKTFIDALEVAESLKQIENREEYTIEVVMAEINHSLSKIDVLALKKLSTKDLSFIDGIIGRLTQLKTVGHK